MCPHEAVAGVCNTHVRRHTRVLHTHTHTHTHTHSHVLHIPEPQLPALASGRPKPASPVVPVWIESSRSLPLPGLL